MGIALLLTRATLRWAAGRGARTAASRFRAVEWIVNNGRPPDAWLEPHARRMEQLRRDGAGNDALAREGRRAQQRCLRDLDQLIQLMKDGSFFDSPDTKADVLEALRERRSAWAAADWRALTRWNA
jgi:hypothetical protein